MHTLAQHSDKLAVFFEVAALGSIQSASRKLGLSAPTILYQLNLLEGACGVSLFVRSKKGMELTNQGQILFEFSKDFFKSFDELESRLHNPLERRPHIRFGTFPSIAIYLWPDLLRVLEAKNVMTLSLTTGRSAEINELLINRSLDVALTVEGKDNPLFVRHELFKDDYGLYSHRDLKLPLSEAKLYYLPDAQDSDGKSLYLYLRESGLIFKEVCVIDSFEVALEFVKQKLGYAILPSRVSKNAKFHIHEHKKLMPRFGNHRFFLNYRKDLDIKKSDVELIKESALKAIKFLDAKKR